MIAAAPLAAVKAYMLVGLMVCAPSPAPSIAAALAKKDPVATHTLDHQALGAFKPSTQFSHASNEVFLTGGITESHIETSFEADFNVLTNTFSRESCLSLKDVRVKISYAPVVHIARDFEKGSCRYNSTWLHELRHVNTDLLTLQEFLPYYKKAIEAAVARIGVQGPVTEDARVKAQKTIAGLLKEALTQATLKMDKLRLQRQQLIDTREEYLRLSKLCP